VSNAVRAIRSKPSGDKWERVRCLRHGNFLRVFRHRYHSKGWYHFPDDAGGRDDLWLLILNTSLAVKEPEKKMLCILDVWAPWMEENERKDYVRLVRGLDLYQRIMTSREIGRRLGLTNAERELLKVWQFLPIDMTDQQLAKHRKDKNNARRKAKRNKTRVEYLSSCLTATKPWKAEGISRRTWERKRVATRGRNNSIRAASILATAMQAESQIGYQEGVKPRDVVRKGVKVRERERNASGSDDMRPYLRQVEDKENSKSLAGLAKLKDGIDGK
jgi:hypothetical protein